ncbi:MAG: hypothetical protein KDK91_23805 [Gammaproteobacteria bacterium]|nr:hypothetical protein [Gammaproteobacteria bacterium]
MSMGILIAGFDYSGAHEDEFHDWYDFEHLPERQRIQGFSACERWIGVDNPKLALATYDLDTVTVLDGDAYLAVAHDNISIWSKRVVAMCDRLIRFEGEQTNPGAEAAPTGAGGLLLNAMNVDAEHESEFNAWYDQEHIPALRAVPGVLSARRFLARDSTHRHVALYHVRDPQVVLGEAWQAAASSEWTDRMRPHFKDRLRMLMRAYRRGG